MRDDDLVLKIQQSSVKVEAKQIQQETRHEAGSKKTLTGRGGRYNAGQARSSWFSSGVCNAQNSGFRTQKPRCWPFFPSRPLRSSQWRHSREPARGNYED